MTPNTSYDKLVNKWAPVLNEETAGPISDNHRRQVTAAILENQEIAMREEAQQSSFGVISEAGTSSSSTDSSISSPTTDGVFLVKYDSLMVDTF